MENSKIKVLVVDDDENLRKALTDKLAASGFQVASAENGKMGLEKALAEHPDVILLDVLMPIMDGWVMLGLLRRDEWGKNAKVVMLTVVEDAEAVARAVQGGSFNYLLKTGHSIDDIIGKIREILKT